MLLLIDGYNLLKTMQPRNIQLNRDAFLAVLNLYAKHKKHHIMVIFDAGPVRHPLKERHDQITVFYSGSKSADEIIQELLDVYEKQKNMLLISSDMQLKHYAKLRQIVALDSELFSQFLPERKKNIQSLNKTGSIDTQAHKFEADFNPELDALMNKLSTPNKQEYEQDEDSEHEWLKELAQNDKKLLNILKKL